MANAMVALANLTLGSAQSTVTFSNIPTGGTYRDLRLVINGRSSGVANMTGLINGDTGSNYSNVIMSGDGSTARSTSNSGSTSLNTNWYCGFNTTTPATYTLDYMDYSATDKHKIVLSRANNTDYATEANAARWASTAAITSLSVTLTGGNTFSTGATFALYGIVS